MPLPWPFTPIEGRCLTQLAASLQFSIQYSTFSAESIRYPSIDIAHMTELHPVCGESPKGSGCRILWKIRIWSLHGGKNNKYLSNMWVAQELGAQSFGIDQLMARITKTRRPGRQQRIGSTRQPFDCSMLPIFLHGMQADAAASQHLSRPSRLQRPGGYLSISSHPRHHSTIPN